MKLAVFSDVHADVLALEAVLASAERQGADTFLCLGDIVGYGTEPQACVDLLRARGIPTVRGNHDSLAARPYDPARPCALSGIDFARRELTDDAKRWLRELPLVLQIHGVTAVHASLAEPEAWHLLDTREAAARCFGQLRTAVGFFGHTHRAGYWDSGTLTWHEAPWSHPQIQSGARYLLNPGAVSGICPCSTFLLHSISCERSDSLAQIVAVPCPPRAAPAEESIRSSSSVAQLLSYRCWTFAVDRG